MKALVVDDSPVMRALIKRILELSGRELEHVAEAENGREALEVIAKEAVDLVFCDINMPEMDGEQFLTALAAEGKVQRTCVIVVSTDGTNGRMDRMLNLGARGYLTKPFTPEAIRTTLERVLN